MNSSIIQRDSGLARANLRIRRTAPGLAMEPLALRGDSACMNFPEFTGMVAARKVIAGGVANPVDVLHDQGVAA